MPLVRKGNIQREPILILGGPMLPPTEAPARLFVCAQSLQSCPTLCDPIVYSPSGSPWDSPGKNTGVEVAIPQGIFPTQGSNLSLLRLLHWLAGSSPLAPPPRGKIQGSPKSVEIQLPSKTKIIPEDLNSPVSRLYGHPIGTFKFRIPKYIFQKFLVCYITQHISLGDSNFGFWGFFWHHFPEPGRAVWAESQMHGGGVSE